MTLPTIPLLLESIKQNHFIDGTDPSGGFSFCCDFSTPIITTAIHAGHHVRKELRPLMKISPDQRLFEEDTATDQMIQGLPNTIWGLESRAVYDLNRPPELALPLTPEKFWGIQVYEKSPTPEMNRISLESHNRFYHFMGTLVSHILDRFNVCIVIDVHSYNISRQKEKGIASPPVFNLGTKLLDHSKWQRQIAAWLEALKAISLPQGLETTVAENRVFSGKGELCRCLSAWDDRILVLPTEVSKVYMDEHTGRVTPGVVQALQQGFQEGITQLPW